MSKLKTLLPNENKCQNLKTYFLFLVKKYNLLDDDKKMDVKWSKT